METSKRLMRDLRRYFSRNFNLKLFQFYFRNFYYYKFKARFLKDILRKISPIELKCSGFGVLLCVPNADMS